MITLDFETFYTKDYTLKKLTSEAYIRHPLFATLGVGVKVDEQPCVWHTGGIEALRGALAQYDWRQPVVVHNGFFDIAILGWVFNIRPKFIIDTMLMAKPKHAHDIGTSLDALADYYNLGRKTTIDFINWHPDTISSGESERLGDYCCNDVDLTYRLFGVLRRGFPVIELAVIDKTIRMYSEPSLILDVNYLQAFVDGKIIERDEKIEALSHVISRPITEKHLASNQEFSRLLMELDYVVPLKPSPSNPLKMIPALAKTDTAFKMMLDSDDPEIKLLAEARLGVKSVLDRTRAESLKQVAARGALPIMLHYYGAHTGRFSGGEKLNLQNLPRNGKLRKALLAPPGYVIIAADSSQIEARLTAWLAGQMDMLQQFRDYDADPDNNPSPYEIMASTIYGRTITRGDKLERFVGKTCIAEGELVLTDRGQIPIEQIGIDDRVWDGVEWVHHEGVKYAGEKEVITYQGLTATPDHIVVTAAGGAVSFRDAASQMVRLEQTGFDGQTIRTRHRDFLERKAKERISDSAMQVHSMWGREGNPNGQSPQWQEQRMSDLFTDKNKIWRTVRQKVRCYISEMHESEEPRLQTLRRAGNTAPIQIQNGICAVGRVKSATSRLQRGRNRSNRQQWSLRTREFKTSYQTRTTAEPTKYCNGVVARPYDSAVNLCKSVQHNMDTPFSSNKWANGGTDTRKVRVYDIVNAGPRHCFTVSNILVFNCILGLGYGMGALKFRLTLRIGQGGISVDYPEAECQNIVDIYRARNRHIKNLWKEGDRVLHTIYNNSAYMLGGKLSVSKAGIELPNKMDLGYVSLEPGAGGQWGYCNTAKSLPRIVLAKLRGDPYAQWLTRIYGPKVIENVVQALARIAITEQMLIIGRKYRVALQVHDENVAVVREEEAVEAEQYIRAVMSTPPSWAPDLPINCDIGVGKSYGDC